MRQGRERAEIRELRENPTTRVLIVGGGINGLALFRELALNGVPTVLVDGGDFASGATAASSHMIHGGIRYLENGELRLVRESVQERNALLRIAPHRVRPLETTIPIFSTFSGIVTAPLRLLSHSPGRPVERGALLIRVGLFLYDLFSRDGGRLPRSRFAGRRRSLAAFPRLNPGVKYTATYFDAAVHDPEHLGVDVLLDGLAAGPHARAANYLRAVGADARGVRLRDEETGSEFSVAAELVVNASGPWTDLTNAALGAATTLMGGTKGSHIVLDSPELLDATGGDEIFFENSDGRIVLIYPLKGRVLVGTTDLEADPSQPTVCTDQEVQYFFDLVRYVFPTVPLGESDIVYRYAGIRPLPQHGDLRPGFVSRDYRIVETPLADGALPALSLVGGKLTTFRALGEHLADEVMGRLGVRRTVDTGSRRFNGAGGFPAPEQRANWLRRALPQLSPARSEVLLTRYGTRAVEVADAEAQEPGGVAPVAGALLSRGELRYLVDRERVARLSDVLLRRTDLAFTGAVTRELIDEVAEGLREPLQWSDERVEREIADAVALLRDRHDVPVEASAREA